MLKAKAQRALYDLQDLVHHDQGVLVPVTVRDISKEILGICQELAGDYQAALYSYQQSLRQLPVNNIQSSTRHKSFTLVVLQIVVIDKTQFLFEELLF